MRSKPHQHLTLLAWCAWGAMLFAAPAAADAQSGLSQQELSETVTERQIDYLETLIDREPSLPMHYIRMAQAHAQLGREAAVLRYTDESVRRGGSRLAAELVVADFYFNQGRYEDALARYTDVLRRSPRQSHAQIRAWMIIQRSRIERVALRFDLADMIRRLNNAGLYITDRPPALDPARSRARLDEANRMLNQGNVSGAVSVYKEAAALDPFNSDAYRGLGVAYARSRDNLRALGAYQLYVALAPPNRADVPRVRKIIIDFYSAGY